MIENNDDADDADADDGDDDDDDDDVRAWVRQERGLWSEACHWTWNESNISKHTCYKIDI